MKPFISATYIFILIFVFSTPLFATPLQSTRIGVSLPLTGEGAVWGLDMKDALEFANEKIGKGKYDLIFEDDKCSPKDSVSVVHRLINIKRVPYLLGYACSGSLLPVAPIVERSKIPTMVTVASSPKISQAGDYIFRTWPNDGAAANMLFEHIAKQHRKSIVIISSLTDYPQDFKSAFIEANAGKKIQIGSEDYLPDATDFRSLLTKIRVNQPESLFLNVQYENSLKLLLEQLEELHWHPILYAAYYPSSPVLFPKEAKFLEGIEFVDLQKNDELLTEEGKALWKEFSSKHPPRSLESLFPSTFEGFRALTQAIESGEDVRHYLYTHSFEGLFGKYSFDKNGEIVGLTFAMKRIRDGKIEKIDPSLTK